MSLGKRLKEARKKRGLSQIEVAQKLNISNQVISNYERDFRDPDTKTLKQLSDLYNVSTDYLVGKAPIENNNKASKLTQTFNEVIEELKDEDTLLFKNDGEFDEETALLIKKALKNGIKLVDELKRKE
ncbi:MULTISPECIES: helix-turn-helix domain-containing protein [Bacillus subtilis group]|uniref:helix-turn-helix domain-containing protein n=1 Tax=Bacillus subtilis group TaxID=653685 RepID=UPI00227FE3AB|nr:MULTISPECIES: helix-turn-helix transcriptional regulator [Bacillus subtilis group]MCY8775014.1 helix-turn-helix transcriptional regulator [Bacillus spizizenii]MCY8209595.1 helix-turn-helix transcriptional regulator [Bacillus subtilis]MCY9255674.1 helix-turn-helix transcriptional regulator [Bacillus spizizenii]MEC0881797.1 helix-turn-helix transcriptional regulator [Bacillus spizizenii]MEC1681591.1 helix-turn-helix transcriptional regulator [Bacillus mojavensis]